MAKKTSKKTSRPAPGPRTRSGGKTGASAVRDAGPMSLPLLEQLVRLMAENELSNIELQDGEQRIHLSRGGHSAVGPMQMMQPGMMAPPAQMPSSPAATAAPPAEAAKAPEAGKPAGNLVEIKSPMVGTFYASPSPDAKAYVQVGDKVGPETDVCIIEAMKVFNNIKAEVTGTIEKILAENGQAVEYGQPLFLVKPA